ncbi:COP9 signalosome complex subunit 7 [Neolecta irregularis DAH-3]|uniref:COP9 signalosome complex subunit 7 n=1 Tax=Neolecta irregularis (strain DAH-3) TaxID=1198029 RepID=A0A1U7LKQ0_NEOID|nr:COP9 signalosome complex subunit 7 [Neolecta irregularis DAH-3]|eukprot:OLL23227.1 COP9 signalosome complex subunit 7 [Neolecta irregularis DAH-3]
MSYLAALQKYVLLAKSLKSKAAADLIYKATSDPECFVFKELLDCPNIHALKDGEFEQIFNILQVFCWGTLKDLDPELLSPIQRHKLQQLTLVTLCSQNHVVPYSELRSDLNITSQAALEDLIINTIYASLLSAKLDSKNQILRVSSTFGRDLSPTDPSRILAIFKQWNGQCTTVLADITRRVEYMRNEAQVKDIEEDNYRKEIDSVKAGLKKVKGERMDVDEVGLAVKAEKKRRVARGARRH